MTVDTVSTLRNYIISTASVTSLVAATSIKVGWQSELTTFPSILMYQVAGNDVGYMAYNTQTAGSKLRLETSNINVDIISRTSMYHSYQIADVIVPVMISGGCRKVQDIDYYDDKMKAHRKILTFRTQRHQED